MPKYKNGVINAMERVPFHSLVYYQEHLEPGETILWGRNRSREDILTWILNVLHKMNRNLIRSLIFGVPIFLVGVFFMQLFFQRLLPPGIDEITTES